MLALLTATQPVACDVCGRDAAHLMVNTPAAGFASQLCPLHLAVFVQQFMDCPDGACEGLPKKRFVTPDQ